MRASRSVRFPFGPTAFGLGLALAAAACTVDRPEQPANDGDGAGDPVVNLPVVPRPKPPLDRAGLLAAVARAASSSASGANDDGAQGRLDGRPFEVRIRFGCRGPSLDLDRGWLGWAYDEERRRLRVRARPTIAADEPLVAALAGDQFEAVEGFWIPRPWLLEASCPARAAIVRAPDREEPGSDSSTSREAEESGESDPAAAVPDPEPRSPRIGLAQFFTETDPRTGRRRGRPFESITTLDEGQRPRSVGFTLVLSGRLRALPGIGVIACSAAGPDSPPECIVSADFDRVWIEEPGSGETVAEWATG